jgi:hypothetical protein
MLAARRAQGTEAGFESEDMLREDVGGGNEQELNNEAIANAAARSN